MKRKTVVAILIVIVAIMCCGCGIETQYKSTSNYSSKYSQNVEDDEFEDDIRYKKEDNDHSPTVYITRCGKRYHRPYCSHAKTVYILLTLNQAIDRGYTACYYCCY